MMIYVDNRVDICRYIVDACQCKLIAHNCYHVLRFRGLLPKLAELFVYLMLWHILDACHLGDKWRQTAARTQAAEPQGAEESHGGCHQFQLGGFDLRDALLVERSQISIDSIGSYWIILVPFRQSVFRVQIFILQASR